jgi:hypothetical protein
MCIKIIHKRELTVNVSFWTDMLISRLVDGLTRLSELTLREIYMLS